MIGVVRKGGVTLLNVGDDTYGGECAVRCEGRRADTGDAVRIMPGDAVWWQCGKVYWTPKRGKAPVCRYQDHPDATEGDDIPLRKIGYSH